VHPTAVINVAGLTQAMLGEHTPHLNALRRDGACAPVRALLPAVTCTAQATYITGKTARAHGIVGNGWYFPDLAQVMFWKQADQLVQGERVWVFCALGARLEAELGPFPFFDFWGPRSGIRPSEWIAEASLMVDRWHAPTLLMVYLPHLDYDLQRFGVRDPRTYANAAAIDSVVGRVLSERRARGRRIIVLSEEISVRGVVNDALTLEFVANPKGGFKAYESALELDTDGINFNLALILIGLDPAPTWPTWRAR